MKKRPAAITLRSIKCFQGLPDEALLKISKQCEIKVYKQNVLLMSQNALAEKVGFLVSGFVKLMRGDRQSVISTDSGTKSEVAEKRMLIDLLGPGDEVGVASVLLGKAYSTSAISLTQCTVVLISAEAFISLLNEIHGLSQKVMNSLAKGLIASEKHAQLMNGDLKTRVHMIRERCSQLGVDVDKCLTNAEVARMAGATRVAVSQIMNRNKSVSSRSS